MSSLAKQKFYIMAHNPNTVADAEAYLKAGANALEPDICFDADEPDQYFVSHSHVSTDPDSYDFTHEHSLAAYMLGLKNLVLRNNFNLALIAFDYKDAPNGNINDLLKIVHDNFTVYSPICAGVAIMITVPHTSVGSFLTNYDQSISNVGVTVDQDDDCAKVQELFVKAKQTRFGFGDGIMVAGVYPGIFKAIMKAKMLQAAAATPEERFRLIHTWVLADADSIRSYLDLHIDGIIVNLS